MKTQNNVKFCNYWCSIQQVLTQFVDFNDLYEAYYLLNNGKVDGILEEMFTAIEFIKGKADSPLLTIAQALEEKQGHGAAIKMNDFNYKVLECLPKLIEFVSYEVSANTSKSVKVRMLL